MLIPAAADDILSLARINTVTGTPHDPDSAIASPEVLCMLAELASAIESHVVPAAWFIVEAGEKIGLLSITRVPSRGELNIGYGVAPRHQGAGVATRAIADLVHHCRADGWIQRITAETAIGNRASQRVLVRNGFIPAGSRTDTEDGELLCWALRLA